MRHNQADMGQKKGQKMAFPPLLIRGGAYKTYESFALDIFPIGLDPNFQLFAHLFCEYFSNGLI